MAGLSDSRGNVPAAKQNMAFLADAAGVPSGMFDACRRASLDPKQAFTTVWALKIVNTLLKWFAKKTKQNMLRGSYFERDHGPLFLGMPGVAGANHARKLI